MSSNPRIKKLTLRIPPEQQGQRLDAVLAGWLPQALSRPVSKAKVRKLVVAGAVYLNGKRVRIASKELRSGAHIDVYVDVKKLLEDAVAKDIPFKMTAADVLYEDAGLIVVNKPAGLPTQPTVDEARDNLFAAVKRFLAERDGVAQPYVGLHHRLDRDTSGVILLTKDPALNAGVARLFAEHLAEKIYNAITLLPSTLPGNQWTVKNYLGRSRAKKARFESVRSGGDFAQTDFKLLEKMPRALWVEARPRTGRTHQIRVHLAERGMPILGDATYAQGTSAERAAARLMLHAISLSFRHPATGAPLVISSPLPDDFIKTLEKSR